jgi:hypothetical protein
MEHARYGTPTSAGIAAMALAAAGGLVLGFATVLGYWALLRLLVGWAYWRTDELILRYCDLLAADGALPEDLKSADNAATAGHSPTS